MRLLVLLPLLSACAANLSTLQSPDTLAPGQVSVALQASAGVPLGTTGRAAAAAVKLTEDAATAASDREPLPEDTEREVFAAGAGFALSPPGTVTGIAARVGVVTDTDVGFRWSSTDWRLDAKRQIGHGDAVNAVMLGLQRQKFRGLVFDAYDALQQAAGAIPGLELDDPSRWDVELMGLRGRSTLPYVKTWWGVRARLGWWSLPSVLSADVGQGVEVVDREHLKGTGALVGLNGGLGVGYDPVWLRIEADPAWAFQRTEILGQTVKLGGPDLFFAVSVGYEPK